MFGLVRCRPALISTSRRFHAALFRNQLIIENVPALGESITEGEISTWFKSVGERVAVDDVIVIVETDKVTVDIKSPYNGILKRQLGGQQVEVGQPLYEIDVDAGSTVQLPTSTVSDPSLHVEKKSAIISPTPNKNTHGRVPLIKFLGKRSLLKKPAVDTTTIKSATTQTAPKANGTEKSSTGVEFHTLPEQGWYGRPMLSQIEIEAVESGGATVPC